MKRIVPILLILPFVFSCVLYSTPPLGETNFPLKQIARIPIEGIIGVAVGDTWIAASTDKKIIAIDISDQKILWSIDFSVDGYSKFQIVNDVLFAASQDEVIMVNKQGLKKEIALSPLQESFSPSINIIMMISVYPDYLYVIRGSNWYLEAYDISANTMLWRKGVGRGIADVSYDPVDKLVYVTIDDTVYVNDNLTGEFLRKQARHLGEYLVGEVLYTLSITKKDNTETHYEIDAVDTKTQEKLWSNSFVLPANNFVGDFLTVGDLLVISGDGMIAFDRFDGEEIWEVDVHTFGEGFDVSPVEFDNVIYAIGYASKTVFAILPDDGSIIGTANLEKDNLFSVSSGEMFNIGDGILLTTSDAILIYKNK